MLILLYTTRFCLKLLHTTYLIQLELYCVSYKEHNSYNNVGMTIEFIQFEEVLYASNISIMTVVNFAKLRMAYINLSNLIIEPINVRPAGGGAGQGCRI